MSEQTSQEFRLIRGNDGPHYEALARQVLQDSSLDWEARGLWAYMRSMPENWSFNEKHLITQSPGGRAHLRKCLRQLTEAGLLTRKRQNKFNPGMDWIVHALPVSRTDKQSDRKSVGLETSRTEKQSDRKSPDIEKTQTALEKTQFLERTHTSASPAEPAQPVSREIRRVEQSDYQPDAKHVPQKLRSICTELIDCWQDSLLCPKDERSFKFFVSELEKIRADPNGGIQAVKETLGEATGAEINGSPWRKITHTKWRSINRTSGLTSQRINDRPGPPLQPVRIDPSYGAYD